MMHGFTASQSGIFNKRFEGTVHLIGKPKSNTFINGHYLIRLLMLAINLLCSILH